MLIRYNGVKYVIHESENCNNEEFEKFKSDLQEVSKDKNEIVYKNSLDYDVTLNLTNNSYYLSNDIAEMVTKGSYRSNSIWFNNGQFIVICSVFSNKPIEVLRDGKFWFYPGDLNTRFENHEKFILALLNKLTETKETK